jgi:hypothetical protein
MTRFSNSVFSAVKQRARSFRSFEYLAHDALPRRRQTPAPRLVAPTQNVREPNYGTQPKAYREDMIAKPSTTVYTCDLGNVAISSANPQGSIQTPYGSSPPSNKASA